MSFQNFKMDSHCGGGRHRSATTKDVDFITSKNIRVLIGLCSICNREKFMTVSDNTKVAEGFGEFFMDLGKEGPNVSQKMAEKGFENPGRALEMGANVGTPFANRTKRSLHPHYQRWWVFMTRVRYLSWEICFNWKFSFDSSNIWIYPNYCYTHWHN